MNRTRRLITLALVITLAGLLLVACGGSDEPAPEPTTVAAEPAALVANDGLDGGKQLGGRHDADGHAGAPEHGLDDLAVVVIGNNDAVLNRVSADDPAGGNFQAEHRVAGR